MDDKRIDLMRNQPVPKAIIQLAIPAIMGLVIMALYNAVDTMFVAWLGTEAAGATQVVLPSMMLMPALSMLFAMGGAAYISRLLGQGDKERPNKVSSTMFFFTLGTGILLMIGFYAFLDPLLYFFGASESVLPVARQYAIWIFAGTIFQMANMTMNNLLRSEGSAMFSMIGMMSGAILNIILDPIFIFVLGLGIKGAAMATTLSAIVSSVVLFSHYLRKKSILHINFRSFRPDGIMLREVFKIGTPSLIRQLLASVAVGILNQMATRYGGDAALAGMGLMSRIFMVSMYVLFGFVQGFQPVAGYNYGAKRYDRLRQSVTFTVLITTAMSIITALVFVLLPRQIMGIFRAEPDVVKVAVLAFHYFAVTIPFLGYAITINTLFQAMGKGWQAALLSLSRQGIFFFPMVFVLPRLFGLTGVLLTQPIADVLTTILTAALGIHAMRGLRKKETELKQIEQIG